jgi:TetR/AcrR family transcriptional repressor of nem operon
MKKGELTRRMILAQAAPVFNQKGFAGTALTDLMAATGLEKGGIYRHFESKQALAEEVFDHAWKIAMEVRFAGTEKAANAVDRLRLLVQNFRERRPELVPGGCPLLNTATEADDSNPRLREKAVGALNFWLDGLKSVVEEGKRKGEIRAEVDAAKLATLIVSTLEGSLMVSLLQRSNAAVGLACGHLEEYLETNIRAE